ncbi:MAG: helix-turn-helix domain-containing protein [Deltaproteobacteria bacterium]|nr:helix-turn-helix domain-containing protein [Deltaproteobacteria bacterium]
MSTTIRNKNLYTVAELSQKLNVTPVTIWKYLKQGKLKGQKTMGKWFTIWKYLKQGKLKGQKTMGKWFISDEEIVEFFDEIQ